MTLRFEEYFRNLLPEKNLQELKDSYKKPLRQSLRINTLRISIKEFEKLAQGQNWSITKIPWCKEGFFCNIKNLGNTTFHHAGLFYIQEAASMLPAEVLNPQEEDRILDLCASPGGKTTQLAAKMNNHGLIIANEVVFKRIHALKLNLGRIGVKNTIITSLDSSFFADNLPNFFDKILVDAPCSSEGMVDIMKNIEKTWNYNKVKFNSKRQKRLLKNAFLSLREKGILVYSTCTLNLEENEKVIDDLLKKFPEAELKEIKIIKAPGIVESVDKRLKKTARIWPFLFQTGGFFIAKIIKNTKTPQKTSRIKPLNLTQLSNNEQAQVQSIFQKHFGYEFKLEKNKNLVKFKDKVWISPALQGIKLPKIISPGMPLLTIYERGDFRISHAAVLSFGKKFTKNKITLDEKQTQKYLKREDLIGEWRAEKGPVAVEHNGLILGAGKIIEAKLKNWL